MVPSITTTHLSPKASDEAGWPRIFEMMKDLSTLTLFYAIATWTGFPIAVMVIYSMCDPRFLGRRVGSGANEAWSRGWICL